MTAFALPAARNPFRTERLDRLGYRNPASGAPADLAPLLERFEALGRRAAVVGPEGSGKTTLLDALEPGIASRGFEIRRLRAAAGGRALRGLQPDVAALRDARPAGLRSTVWVIDGYDRLPLLERLRVRRAARAAAGLLIATHRRPRMPVLRECVTTPHLLAALVADLAGPGTADPLSEARELHARHGGNLRTALLELYDRSAGRTGR